IFSPRRAAKAIDAFCFGVCFFIWFYYTTSTKYGCPVYGYIIVYIYIEPKGIDPYTGELRNFNEEFKDFLEKRKTDPDYCPVFYYSELKKLNIKQLEESLVRLDEIEKEALKENENIYQVVFGQIAPIKAKINFLIELRKAHFENGDLQKAFENGLKAYSDIDDDLCKAANKKRKEILKMLKEKPPKSKLEKKLEEKEFDSGDIKNIMEHALRAGGLEKDFKVVIEKGINNMSVSYSAPGHPYNVVMIPRDRKVNGVELPQKIAHEMTHVMSHAFSPKQGIYLGGKESEIYTEGIAQNSEDEIMKYVLGEKDGERYIKSRTDDSLYYILAMEKAKEGSNFAQVYDFIFEKKYEENLLKNEYHILKDEKNKEAGKIKNKSNNDAVKFSKTVSMRIFRGFNFSEGRKYFTKDLIYFKGKIAVKLMKEERISRLYMSRIDPALIPFLEKLGAYASKKECEHARSAVKNIWKEKRWVSDYFKNKKIF
ncbi:MAG: hypothetical protein WA063_06175, partial [Minisyncoccia bacterium]